MPSPNCSLYNKGPQAALNKGVYRPENNAACKIKKIQAMTKSHGLGKGGRRSTRRNKRRTVRR